MFTVLQFAIFIGIRVSRFQLPLICWIIYCVQKEFQGTVSAYAGINLTYHRIRILWHISPLNYHPSSKGTHSVKMGLSQLPKHRHEDTWLQLPLKKGEDLLQNLCFTCLSSVLDNKDIWNTLWKSQKTSIMFGQHLCFWCETRTR